MPFISNGIYNFDNTVYSSKEMLNTSCIELSDAFITTITGNSTSNINIFSQVNKYSQYTDSYLWIGYTGFIYKNHLYQSYISSSSNKFTYIDFDLATKTVTKKTLTTTTSNNTGYWLIVGVFGNKALLRGSEYRDLYILNLDSFTITKFGTLNFGGYGGPWIFNVYNENEIYYYERPATSGVYGIEKMTLSGGITRTTISNACTIKVGDMLLGWLPSRTANSIQSIGSSTYKECTLKMKKDNAKIEESASKITFDSRVIVKGTDVYNPTEECLYSIDNLTSDGTITISTYSSLNPIVRVRNHAGVVNVIQTILKQTRNDDIPGLPQIIDLDNDAICLFTYDASLRTIHGSNYEVTPTPYLFRIELPK